MEHLSAILALFGMVLGVGSTAAFAQQADGIADVLARPVARGAILSQADFTTRPVGVLLARGALRAVDAEGKATTRNIPAGSTLRPGDIAEPALVRRGEAVTLALRSGGMVITAPGRALADAPMGATVRVLNLATNRTLDAIVEGDGRAFIPAPL